jgi:putative membrane protein
MERKKNFLERAKNLITENFLTNKQTGAQKLFLLVFLVGAIGHAFAISRPFFTLVTPYVLLLTNISVLITALSISKQKRTLIYWFAGTALTTFLLEALGVKTGLVFGSYNYGKTLGVKLFRVPVVIALNWVGIVYCTIALVKSLRIKTSRVISALAVGIITVTFDLIMEPVAIKLDYWQWEIGYVPLQNYIAWFLISFSGALVFLLLKLKIKQSRFFINFLLSQILFFAILNIFL